MINQQWPIYADDENNYVRALPIDSIVQYANGQASIRFANGYAPVEVDASFMSTWKPQKGGYLITVPGEYIYMSKASFEATYTKTDGLSVTPGDITGATTVGINVLTAADQDAARLAINAAVNRLANSTQPGFMTPEQYKKVAGLAIASASAASSDVSFSDVSFDSSGKATLALKIGDGKVGNRAIASSGLSGTNIKTANTVTSAGGAVTIPAGTDHDAALKILADAVNPAAG